MHLSITAPLDIKGLCVGRPVEELPRILTILSPAHHLVSAKALDHLFEVTPPETAANIREVLLQNIIFLNHLRKIYFLLFSWINPTLSHGIASAAYYGLKTSGHILDDIMRHMALSQESFILIGGKTDHPVSAVAGGMTQMLKPEHCERLAKIAHSCFEFSLRLSAFLHDKVLGPHKALAEISDIAMDPVSGLVYDPVDNMIILQEGIQNTEQRFSPVDLLKKAGRHQIPWSYEPMAFLKDSSDEKFPEKIDEIDFKKVFLTGPLARLNRDQVMRPEAEAERRLLLETVAPLPQFNMLSAFWSILVELIEAGEKMVELCTHEKIGGQDTLNRSSHMANEGLAALESPSGLIYHHYQVDEKGIVKGIDVLDTTIMNNMVRHLVIQKTVEKYLSAVSPAKKMKQAIERVLLTF